MYYDQYGRHVDPYGSHGPGYDDRGHSVVASQNYDPSTASQRGYDQGGVPLWRPEQNGYYSGTASSGHQGQHRGRTNFSSVAQTSRAGATGVVAPICIARFSLPARAWFPLSTYPPVGGVRRVFRLLISSYPRAGSCRARFSRCWLRGLPSSVLVSTFSGSLPNLSFSGNSEPFSAGSSFVACGACCVTVVAALFAVPLSSVRLRRARTTSPSSSDGAGAHRPAFLLPP